jgi:8-oxo-dGTP pyrophosphatase MutT (NUDIX family)
MLDYSLLNVNQKLKEILSHRPVEHSQAAGRVPSAVLLPLFIKQDRHYLLFTRRTHLVHYHKGEISFPGGGYHESDDTLLNTALRESHEEIGLKPQDVEVLGELDDLPTRFSNYIISPFVGLIAPDYPFVPSQFEIAEIINIPVAALLEKECCHFEPVYFENGIPYHPHVYYFEDKKITGATASILKQFLEIYLQVI